ncbi:MAG TPA: hypothetical protein VGC37_18685 [Friedmanniella sp.]
MVTNDPTTPTAPPGAPGGLREYVLRVDALPHTWQVAATLLLGGAIAAGAYGLAQTGALDIAATLLTAWVIAFARYTLSGRQPAEGSNFAVTRGLVAAMRADATTFMASRTTLARAILAALYAIGFAVARELTTWALGAMSNIWFAVAAGLLVASVIASPVLWRALSGSLAATARPSER